VIMAREEAIVPADFPPQIRMLSQDQEKDDFMIPSGISLDEMERALIVKTLAETNGNRTRTSEILGINRRTLQNKLKQYALDTQGAGQPF
jgi:two-component system response regulator HydG